MLQIIANKWDTLTVLEKKTINSILGLNGETLLKWTNHLCRIGDYESFIYKLGIKKKLNMRYYFPENSSLVKDPFIDVVYFDNIDDIEKAELTIINVTQTKTKPLNLEGYQLIVHIVFTQDYDENERNDIDYSSDIAHSWYYKDGNFYLNKYKWYRGYKPEWEGLFSFSFLEPNLEQSLAFINFVDYDFLRKVLNLI